MLNENRLEPTLQRIRELYPELGLQPWHELDVDALLYGAPDALVSHARGPGAGDRLVIHARTRPALEAVAEALALTGAVADLRLGTGITAIAADPTGRLTVATKSGPTVALRLDLDHLWPTRDMQRRLSAVDWPARWTTRGPAHPVPSLVTRAASDDEQLALDAAGQLYKLLVSRSGRLPAAPVAVAFLVDLMLRPGAQAQNIVLMMIADIADTRRGAKKPDEVAAVRAAIPALAHFRDDPAATSAGP